VTSSRKFLLPALVSAAFICANGLCQAADNLPRNAAAKSDLNSDSNTYSKEPITDVTTRLDQFIQQRVEQLKIPGYSLAIIHDGKVVFKKGYGTTDLENGTPVTSKTVFGLASITKTFTGMALLALVDQGKINLDDRLDKYLDGLAKPWQPITIRQLASMTGGILQSMPNETVWSEQFTRVQKEPLASTPGSEFLYSNYSYRTLGSVIEKVSGKKYLDFVRELIIVPLGMTATGTQFAAPAGTLASPYMQQQQNGTSGAARKLPPYRDPAIPFAAGMLFSNVDDMLKYAQALIDGKILSPQGYKTLWVDRPPLSSGKPSNWAFGWGATAPPSFGNRRMLAMNGGVPGVASSILIFPDQKVAVIALSNLRKKPVHKIARDAAQIYFNQERAVDPGEDDIPDAEPAGVRMEAQ
jgi:CubicO group peptidase (beta-lactamase class C family)